MRRRDYRPLSDRRRSARFVDEAGRDIAVEPAAIIVGNAMWSPAVGMWRDDHRQSERGPSPGPAGNAGRRPRRRQNAAARPSGSTTARGVVRSTGSSSKRRRSGGTPCATVGPVIAPPFPLPQLEHLARQNRNVLRANCQRSGRASRRPFPIRSEPRNWRDLPRHRLAKGQRRQQAAAGFPVSTAPAAGTATRPAHRLRRHRVGR